MVDLRDMSIFVCCTKTVTYWITRFLLHTHTQPTSSSAFFHTLYVLKLLTKYKHIHTIRYKNAMLWQYFKWLLSFSWLLIGTWWRKNKNKIESRKKNSKRAHGCILAFNAVRLISIGLKYSTLSCQIFNNFEQEDAIDVLCLGSVLPHFVWSLMVSNPSKYALFHHVCQ